MGRFYFLIVIIVLIALFVTISFILTAYKKCPPGHVLIINNSKPDSFGNLNKIIFSGGAFVWPLVGSYQIFSLAPIIIDLHIQELAVKNQQKINFDAQAIIGISTSETVLKNAIDRFSGQNTAQIQQVAKNIILGQIRLLASETGISEIENFTQFSKKLSKEIEGEMIEIGLKRINLDITKVEKT